MDFFGCGRGSDGRPHLSAAACRFVQNGMLKIYIVVPAEFSISADCFAWGSFFRFAQVILHYGDWFLGGMFWSLFELCWFRNDDSNHPGMIVVGKGNPGVREETGIRLKIDSGCSVSFRKPVYYLSALIMKKGGKVFIEPRLYWFITAKILWYCFVTFRSTILGSIETNRRLIINIVMTFLVWIMWNYLQGFSD